MGYIQSYLEDADTKQSENRAVATLVSDIRSLGLDLENIIDTYFPVIASPKRKGFLNQLRSGISVFNYIHKVHNFVEEMQGIRTRVDNINCRRLTYGIQEISCNDKDGMWEARRSFPHLDEPNIVGFEEHIQKLVARMQDKDSQCGVISITGMAGSRIILTSRNKDVGVNVGGQNSLHELQPLNPINSRNLFFKIVRGSPENMEEQGEPSELENIAEQILKRCGGVPLAIGLAIVLAAGMLLQREETKDAWIGVLERMGHEEDECSKTFALSYKDLPISLKPCFLYFGLFPEDHEIIASNLIDLWAAERFIQGSGVRGVEEVGRDYLNHLLDRNLIQVAGRNFHGRIKSLRIHDILQSLCVRVAKEINFFSFHNNDAPATTSSSIISASAKRVRRFIAYDPTLSLGEEYRSEDWRFVQVLSLEGARLSDTLQSEIGNWSHLICVRLKSRDGRIKLPSTISNLKSLQILDVWDCILPKCVWKMKQLRHVLLHNYCYAGWFYEGQLGEFLHSTDASSLNLETLYGLALFIGKYWFPKFTNLKKLGLNLYCSNSISNVKKILDAITAPHKLEVMRLSGGGHPPFWKLLDLNLSRFENLTRLHLDFIEGEFPVNDKLPPNLAKVTLRMARLRNDPMEILTKIPKLKILKLRFVDIPWILCFGNDFPQLQLLDIENPYCLRVLVVEEEAMPRLSKFRIARTRLDPLIRIPNRIRDIMVTT